MLFSSNVHIFRVEMCLIKCIILANVFRSYVKVNFVVLRVACSATIILYCSSYFQIILILKTVSQIMYMVENCYFACCKWVPWGIERLCCTLLSCVLYAVLSTRYNFLYVWNVMIMKTMLQTV